VEEHLVIAACVGDRDDEGLAVLDDGEVGDTTRVEHGVQDRAVGDCLLRQAMHAGARSRSDPA
jgi:hypothetical protein